MFLFFGAGSLFKFVCVLCVLSDLCVNVYVFDSVMVVESKHII